MTGIPEVAVKEIKKVVDASSKTKAFETGIRKEVKHIKTPNEVLAGQRHPETGVPFVKNKFTIDGQKMEGVFPKFDAVYETRLPREQWKQSDAVQIRTCVQRLKEAIEKNPELAKKFTPRQLEQIRNNSPVISNLTWHHKENGGIMQLVDAEKHAKTHHTGGASIWGSRS